MPRPKPPEPLTPRYIRMSDSEWEKFQEMGGADWLRRVMRTRPKNYYSVFERPSNPADAVFINQRREIND
jgi:hypothetical protein